MTAPFSCTLFTHVDSTRLPHPDGAGSKACEYVWSEMQRAGFLTKQSISLRPLSRHYFGSTGLPLSCHTATLTSGPPRLRDKVAVNGNAGVLNEAVIFRACCMQIQTAR